MCVLFAVDGGWSDWMNWTECSTSCEVGHKLRFRSCTNPKPQYGGRDCQGVREEKAECMLRPHCPSMSMSYPAKDPVLFLAHEHDLCQLSPFNYK